MQDDERAMVEVPAPSAGWVRVGWLELAHHQCRVAWPARARRRPVALLLHGLFDTDGRWLWPWMLELAEMGLVAVIPRSRGRVAAGTPFFLMVQQLVSAHVAAAGAVLDGLAQALPMADTEHTALIGVSAGGFAAWRVAAQDKGRRVRWVASVLSGAGWGRLRPELAQRFAALFNVPVASGGAGEGAGGPPGWGIRLEEMEPLTADLAGGRFLMVQGGADPLMPIEDARHWYERLVPLFSEAPERLQWVVYPRVGHRLTVPMQHRVNRWLGWMALGKGVERDAGDRG